MVLVLGPFSFSNVMTSENCDKERNRSEINLEIYPCFSPKVLQSYKA